MDKREFSLKASDTLQYPEYSIPNWIEDNVYDAKDDGDVLTLSSETGLFNLTKTTREWFLNEFEEVTV